MNELQAVQTTILRPAFFIAVQPTGQVGVVVRAERPHAPAPKQPLS